MNKRVLVIVFSILILVLIILFSVEKIKYIDDSGEITSIEIEDDTEICSEALEPFYEDEKYIYYFSCIKSNNVYAIINGKYKYLVKDLLNHNSTKYDITIEELEDAGLNFFKEEK